MNGQVADLQVQKYFVVHHDELPMSCPRPGLSRWDSHPKVYIHLKPNVRQSCPYCGEVYMLIDE